MNSILVRTFSLLTLSLALAACATHPAQPPMAVARPADSSPSDSPARPFAKDTLYDLMLAEFAANRGRADITLTRYAKQAKATHDPGVLERATEISQYVNAQPLTLELADMWAKADPGSLQAHYLLVLNSLRNQRFDQTIPALDELLKLDPDADLEQIFVNAVPPTREGREKLLAALDGVPVAYSHNGQVYFARALMQDQNGDHQQALVNVRAAQKDHPRNVPDILLESRILMSMGQEKATEERLARAVKDQPTSRALRQAYARILVHGEKYEQAQAQYALLVAQQPDDGDTILTLALLAIERHDETVARTSLNKLVDLDQHSDEAHYYLGTLARNAKDTDAALAELEQVEPGNVFLAARQDMADILLDANDLSAAREKLSAARSLAPDMASQLYAMEADLLTRAKQSPAAFDLLNSALKMDPKNELLIYSRAMTAEKLDNMDVFEGDMHTLLEHDPNNATALNALGYTLAERTDRLDEAQGYISKALALRPNDPAIIDSLGWVKFRKGDAKNALELLQKAYTLMPDDEIAAHVGEVLWAMGRKDEARKVWAEALGKVPDSEFVISTRSRLDQPKH
jgi:tetratricopeptide (TPR) repeat protein